MDVELSNGLTAAEAERLDLLAEECAEVIHAICKIKRHGYRSRNPLLPSSPTNRESLEIELGHLLFAQCLSIDCGDIDESVIKANAILKGNSIGRWLHHQTRKTVNVR
jgi:hypothetical protein